MIHLFIFVPSHHSVQLRSNRETWQQWIARIQCLRAFRLRKFVGNSIEPICWIFRWHAGVDNWLNDQILSSLQVPQVIIWFCSIRLCECPLRVLQIFKEVTRHLDSSFWFGISGKTVDLAYAYCPISIYCIKVPHTSNCVFIFIELKAKYAKYILHHFPYNSENIA